MISSLPNKKYAHVFAVMRIEGPVDPNDITLTKAFWSEDEANREVERLQNLNGEKGYDYSCLLIRLAPKHEEVQPARILPDQVAVLLSFQRALVGAVTPNMLAATVRYSTDPMIYRVHFREEPSEDELELMSITTTEVLADFPTLSNVIEEAVVVGDDRKKLVCLDAWIYMQFDPNSWL